MTMNFNTIKAFEKDLKRLSKKYRSLPEDLEELKRRLPYVDFQENKHFIVLHRKAGLKIIKARFACRSVKGKSIFRIIFAHHQKTNRVEFIDFIELYFKGDQVREDQKRIQGYLKELG